ncbi:MAG: S8 family peptidase [Candidatus Njordarchaeia archaeon]
MKKVLPILVALMLVLPVTTISSHNLVPNANTSNDVSKLTIDVDNKGYGFYIVMLKSEPVKNFFNILEKWNINIKHKYRIIPAILVEGRFKDLLRIAQETGIIKGIYSNYRYNLLRGTTGGEISVATATSASKMGANELWSIGIDGSGVKVAVIDTGIDKSHPDLKFPNGTLKVIYETSFVSPDYGYNKTEGPSDVEGHGTGVSGVIAGTGAQDSERGKGVAPGALLMNAKVFPKGEGATLAAIIAAIEWATFGPDGQPNTGDEADVINMSLGGGQIYNDPMYVAVKKAFENGVTVVIASGNEGDGGLRGMSSGSPGNSEYAITVGATDPKGSSIKDYSSFGPTIRLTVKPDVVAPSGVDILAPGGGYQTGAEGTSFSCPHVAGAAALLAQYLKGKQEPKTAMPATIKVAMMRTAVPVSSFDEMGIGAGFVRVDLAYEYLENAQWENNVPKIWSWLPTHVPIGYKTSEKFFPWGTKIFRGQNIEFNLTIITPVTMNIDFALSSSLSSIFDLHSTTTIPNACGVILWEFNATVKNDAPLGGTSGNITFTSDVVSEKGSIEFSVNVAEAELWMLFDLAHTSWTEDFRYGQYYKLALFAEGMNIAIETLYHGHSLSSVNLNKYDIVYVPDAVSYFYTYNEQGLAQGPYHLNFTQEDVEMLIDYVRNGGVLVLSAMSPFGNSFDEVNKLTSYFGVEFTGPYHNETTTMQLVENNIIVNGSFTLPFYGSYLDVKDSNKAMVLGVESASKKPVLAATILSNGKKSGLALMSTTNFMFDNWAFVGEYSGVPSLYVEGFFTNFFNFVKNMRTKLYIDLPMYTRQTELTAKIKMLSSLNIMTAKLVHGTTEKTLTVNKVNNTDYTATFTPEGEGDYYVALSLGGAYSAKVVSTFSVDNTAPQIKNVTWTPEKYELNGNLTVYVEATDNIKVSNVILSYDMGDGWVNVTMTKTDSTYKYFFNNITVKSLKIKVIVFDAVGNVVVSSEYTIKAKIPAAPMPTNMILIGVGVVVVIAVVAFIFLRKKQS